MPITNTPYCIPADVIAVLGNGADVSDTALITSFIPQAQALIDRYIGYNFQQDGPTTRTFDGSGRVKLFVDEIISFSQVIQTDSNPTSGGGYVWLPGLPLTQDITADCRIGPTRANPYFQLIRLSGNPFYADTQNYQVTGVWGFAAVPLDVARACIRLTVHMVKMKDTNFADVIADSGQVSQRFFKKVPDDVLQILDVLKHKSFYGGAR